MDSRNLKKSHPFPHELSGRVHVLGNDAFPTYLVRGDRSSALIEAGISATAGEAMDQLGRLGVEPDFMVITHPHGDHLTGLDTIRKRFPAIRVIAGEGAAAFLSHPRAAEAIVAEDRHLGAALRAKAYPAGSPAVSKVPLLAGGLIRSDGEELDLGGITLRFLEVPGHAPGNLAVFIPAVRVLLASDCLGFPYPVGRFFPLFFTGYAEYMSTLDRLASLKPAILGLGHHGVMEGAETGAAFTLAGRCASDLRERLRSGPREEEGMVAEIFAEFYRDELTLYSRENIMSCCRLLIRRSREEVEAC
jgi:glyoxylase-like metal-dependent hydrolase (beta-lactamase superfamily II)